MARIKSVYNDIGIATDNIVDIISYNLGGDRDQNYGDYLDKYIEGGFTNWQKDLDKYKADYDFFDGPLKTGYNEIHTMGILKNRPELHLRIGLAMMKKAREEGSFSQLSDEEFNNLIDEFKKDPTNFQPAKRRAISIKYDKELQKDIATRKGISTDDVVAKMGDFQKKFEEQQLEEWQKRQWQLRAGIIK
jgi:hypothetical protein